MRRAEYVTLVREVHDAYKPGCDCSIGSGKINKSQYKQIHNCARETLLDDGFRLTHELWQFGYTNRAMARGVGVDDGTMSRINSGQDVPLGLPKLYRLINELKKLFQEVRARHFDMSVTKEPITAQPIKLPTMALGRDYCNKKPITEDVATTVDHVLNANIRRACLNRPVEEREPLPDGIEGVLGILGDPEYGLWVMQLEPTDRLERLKRQRHEVAHILQRLDAQILELEPPGSKNKTPRARF